MRKPNAPRLVTFCALLAACTGSERSGEGPWHEPLPSLTLVLSPSADSSIVLDTARTFPAPEIRFSALLQPDPNHLLPAMAPVTGVLIRIAQEHHARRGEILAVVGQGSQTVGREVTVRAPKDGTWRPRRDAGQMIWEDDTLGVLAEHGYWLAVGALYDGDARLVHQDDPAVVLVAGETDAKHHGRPARVEWVRATRLSSYMWDVAVDFRAPEAAFERIGFATVVVTPSGPGDSLAAVPASAVVHLPLGPAVFVPAGRGRYEVRWIATGSSADGQVVVREGVKAGTTVVAHGLAALVEKARDSLAQRHPRP